MPRGLVHGQGRQGRPERQEAQARAACCGLVSHRLRRVLALQTETDFLLRQNEQLDVSPSTVSLDKHLAHIHDGSLQNYLYGQRNAGFSSDGRFPGGQTGYVRVPKGEVNLLPLPDEVKDEQALFCQTSSRLGSMPLSTPVSKKVMWSGLGTLMFGPLRLCLVIPQGLGPVGQCVAQWAKLKGASRVIGIDTVPERMAFAKLKTGIEVIDFREHRNIIKWIYELVPRGLDVGIDCGKSRCHTSVSISEPNIYGKVRSMNTGPWRTKVKDDVPEIIRMRDLRTASTSVRSWRRVFGKISLLRDERFKSSSRASHSCIGNGQAPVHKY